MASEPVPLNGLARRLVEENIIPTDTALNASEEANKNGVPFVSYLVQNGHAEARTIAASAAEEFGVPFMDLAAFDLEALPKLSHGDVGGKGPNDGERQHVTEVSRRMRSKNTGSGGI